MNPVLIYIIGGVALVVIGADTASYILMRKVDSIYKKRYKYLLGYNTYRIMKFIKKTG
jgi:hypothetical protein